MVIDRVHRQALECTVLYRAKRKRCVYYRVDSDGPNWTHHSAFPTVEDRPGYYQPITVLAPRTQLLCEGRKRTLMNRSTVAEARGSPLLLLLMLWTSCWVVVLAPVLVVFFTRWITVTLACIAS